MKTKIQYIFIFFIALCNNSFAQPLDSTIFINEFEKLSFISFLDSTDINPLKLLICSEGDKINEYHNNLARIITELNNLGIQNTSINKKIKIIHKTIHNNYLKKYNVESYFYNLFETGNFNCVSASALYALLFSHYNISYSIKETPIHIYLMVNSGKKEVMIETLLEKQGIIQYDERYKKNYIDYLYENKIISDFEMRTMPIDTIFNKHHNQDKTINIIQLAGLQYYNKGIFLSEKSMYKEAFQNFEKAEILYSSSNTIKFAKDLTIKQLLIENNANKNYDGRLIAKYINNNPGSQVALKAGLEFFREASNELMINRPDIEKYQSFYNEFTKFTNDSIDISEYHQIYHFYFAYYYSTQFQLYKAIQHLKPAYDYNPENIQMKQFIIEITVRYLLSNYNVLSIIDSIELYVNKFPFLEEHEKFSEAMTMFYGETACEYFKENNIEKGLECLNKLENKLMNREINSQYEYIINSAFSEATAYYIRNQKFEHAKAIIERGLALIPDSYLLNRHLERLNKTDMKINNFLLKVIDNQQNTTTTVFKADDKNKINRAINLYLKKCWYSEKVFEDDQIEVVPIEERILLIFSENSVKVVVEDDDATGTWNFIKEICTISIEAKKNGTKKNIYLKILEMTNNTMKVIMYNDPKYIYKGEFIFFRECNSQ